ncbi:MAG: transcriptional regulator, partial [Candidatus Binatia bacterium]
MAKLQLANKLARSRISDLRDHDALRGNLTRSAIVQALYNYYGADERDDGESMRFYRAGCEGEDIPLSILARPEWLDLRCQLSYETDRFRLSSTSIDDSLQIDALDAERAVRRLVEAVALDVTLVNSPLYRIKEYSIHRGQLSGLLSVVPFVQYALTTDLLELELIDQLVAGRGDPGLPMRDKYLPNLESISDVSGRFCSGGVLALCAIARPSDVHRGPADFVLITQERGRQVLNGVGRLSVIPRGFHQPLTDYRGDTSIGATLRRELEEELFHRTDVDNTVSEELLADPMHPSRLSEPMRWLLSSPDKARFECTAFGFNTLNGNFEVACLVVIDDPEFWERFGGQIEANWESTGLRQHSTRDMAGIRDLLREETWSSEGLF